MIGVARMNAGQACEPEMGWRRCRAFTLMEVMIVIVVMSLLAIGVVPALSSASGAQRAGAAIEIERMLHLARARAMATSTPHAVRIQTNPSSLQVCWRNPSTGAIAGVVGGDGLEARPQLLAARFGSTRIRDVEIDGVTGDSGDIWFAFNGVPELRNSIGTRIGPATRDARITLDDGSVVTVVAATGAVTVGHGGSP